jgi:hypothetical protein
MDLFDFITGQMQELALADRDDLQVGLKQRKIPRPQRGQETIASMLVLIWIHVGPTSPSARHSTPVRSRLQATNRFRGTPLSERGFKCACNKYLKNWEANRTIQLFSFRKLGGRDT